MELLIEIDVTCPHCGEVFALQIDTSQGDHSMVEDCSVCCRPIELSIISRPGEILELREAE